MDRRTFVKAAVLTSLLPGASLASTPLSAPPVARRGDWVTHMHGITVPDPYRWLRDPGYPKVTDREILAYLRAENSWFEQEMGPQSMLVEALFEQLKAQIKDDEASVPVPNGAFEYWWKFEPGAQYRQWWRRPRGAADGDEIILSEPAMARGREYFRLGTLAVSPDGRRLAYSFDDSGDERFVLRVRDLETGKDIETVAPDSVGAVAWTADSEGLVWAQASEQWRPDRVRLHRLGTPSGDDPLLYQEPEDFFISVSASQDRRWIFVTAAQSATREVRIIDGTRPEAPVRLVRARTPGLEYSVDASGDWFFIRANDSHPNFRVAAAPLNDPSDWKTLVEGDERIYITGLTPFSSYVAIEERLDGLDQVRLLFPDGRQRRVAFPEPSYAAGLGNNAEADAPLLRLSYSSMVTPNTDYDYDVTADRLIVRKVQEIPSGYDPSEYVTERLMAPARDGARVPVSLVYRKGYPKDGSRPLHVYAYGSYGYAIPPSFAASRLAMLDRAGFAYAIAHVRGGDDLGRHWYLDGKLENKANTFNDFEDVTRFLHGQGFGQPAITSASGGSAGGWLVGAVATQAPDLYGAMVAHVPFVDVLNTMLDISLPLTPGEFPEWGNPIEDPEAFRRLLSLSPYDQVRRQRYPHLLVTAGLNDPRVTYWEPAKWVARLRAEAEPGNLLLLKTNMGAGHGGRSGRFERLREVAEEMAFIFKALDINDREARAHAE
ncbi:MAG: S9 family peptidase [Thermaurantiacus sp.]